MFRLFHRCTSIYGKRKRQRKSDDKMRIYIFNIIMLYALRTVTQIYTMTWRIIVPVTIYIWIDDTRDVYGYMFAISDLTVGLKKMFSCTISSPLGKCLIWNDINYPLIFRRHSQSLHVVQIRLKHYDYIPSGKIFVITTFSPDGM